MTTEQSEPNNRSEQQLTPKPSLTGDRMLDNALEKLRRTLERRKKRPSDPHQPAKEPGTITKPDNSRDEAG